MDLIILALFAALAFLGLAAAQWGVESRSEFIDPRTLDASNRTF